MLKLDYGDNYVKVNNGDVFVGSWDMLEDCFGITSDTITDWCRDNDYIYSVKKYTPEDELIDSLYKLSTTLEDFGTIQDIHKIIKHYEGST